MKSKKGTLIKEHVSMSIQRNLILTLVILIPVLLLSQTTNFNSDSTYSYIKHLSVTIGPRPMGSQNEDIALNWLKEKFDEFEPDTSFIMKFYEVKSEKSSVNTNSGNAVAIFEGETDTTIVIGGHFDSSGREIPGANDNASGTASVIELARIWSQRPRHYTMVFAAFGGEERGLVGSKHFVEQYQDIDKVALMLCLDMTGSDDKILTLAETDSMQAPIWLMKDAFAIDRALGINRLLYPTHFATINNIGGGAGSDHIPFLHRYIPAIDFTSGICNSPIHTPQDKIDFISKEMLGKCGSLADSLLKKYQKFGIPSSTNEPYMLWNVFGTPFFIPSPAIAAFSVVAILLGALAFYISRKNRLIIEKQKRIRFSGLKLLLMITVAAVSVFLGEAFLQLFKGLRYPWLIHFYKYLWFAGIWVVAGVWSVLQLTRKWFFSPDPYFYSKRALIILFLYVIIFMAFVSFRLALYPAITLFLFSLAIIMPNGLFKTLLSFIAPLPMFRLMFSEIFIFPARMSIYGGFSISSFGESVIYSGLLIVILIVWYLPTINLLSFVVVSVSRTKSLLKSFRQPVFGIVIILIILGYGGFLYSLPAYNNMWRPGIRVEAEYDIQKKESKLQLIGNEFFKDVSVKTDSLEDYFSGRSHKEELAHSFTADWINLNGTHTITDSTTDTLNVKVNWQIESIRSWYSVYFQIRVDTLEFNNVESDLNFYHKKDRVTFSWMAEPPLNLNGSANFSMIKGAKLIRKVTGYYPEMPVAIKVTSDLADIRYRTKVVFQDTLDLSLKD
jgi:hypothetical protein